MNSTARTEIAALNKLNQIKHNGRICITSFLQLRESDLFALWRQSTARAHRPALILLFAKKFFRSEPDWHLPEVRRYSAKCEPEFLKPGAASRCRMRWTRSNVLTPGLTKPLLRHHLLPAFTVV